MRAILCNFLRYSCWAVVGAALVYLLFCLWMLSEADVHFGFLTVVAPLSIIVGIVVVVIRAFVGILTRYPASDADRMTAQGIGRFLFGWILGRVALSLYFSVGPWNRDLDHMLWSGWLEIAFRLAGALAMVATGWLAFRRRGRFLFPISWLAVFAILTFASIVTWPSFHVEFSRLLKRIFF